MRDPANIACPNAYECFNGGRFGKGAFENELASAMGGKPWTECFCMNDAERLELAIERKSKEADRG